MNLPLQRGKRCVEKAGSFLREFLRQLLTALSCVDGTVRAAVDLLCLELTALCRQLLTALSCVDCTVQAAVDCSVLC